MKINNSLIHIISMTDLPNGAESVLLKLAIAVKGELIFVRKNVGNSLIIPDSQKRTYLSNTSLLRGLIKLIKELRKLDNKHIVMSTHPSINVFLGFLKRIGYLKPKLIVRECTSVFTRFHGLKKLAYLMLYKMGYPGVDLVICQTDLMKSQLLIHNPFLSKKNVVVRPNPVDTEKLLSLAQLPLTDIESQENYICSAGRLIPEKGFDILIEAFVNLHQKHPDLKLFILGEGKEKEALSELIKEKNLQEAVILKGHILNPAPYFKNARLCVVSSRMEGFPNVLLEMMALNSNVVSTLCAGGIYSIPNIITAKANNVEDLEKAMHQALIHSEKYQTTEFNPHADYLNDRKPSHFAQSILDAIPQ